MKFVCLSATSSEGATDNNSQPLSHIVNRRATYESPYTNYAEASVSCQQLPSETEQQQDYYNNSLTSYEAVNNETQKPPAYDQIRTTPEVLTAIRVSA